MPRLQALLLADKICDGSQETELSQNGLPTRQASSHFLMPTVQEILQQGWKHHQSGDHSTAEKLYQSVLDHAPDNPEALVYLGILRFDQRDYALSAGLYRRALELRDQFPIAWNNLGNTLRMLGDVRAAEECFAKSLEQDPRYLSALQNRGTLWVWAGEIQRGLAWYERALEQDDQNAELHRNLGVIHLLLGNYDIGWPEYRWRWRMPGLHRPRSTAPIWNGEDLDGKTILLYPEQGRGDSIQFIRMTNVLSGAGARVIFQCAQEMMPLFVSAKGISQIAHDRFDSPLADYQASLIEAVDVWYTNNRSLPYATEDVSEGYLDVSPELTEYWRQWLDEHCPAGEGQRRIGINWQGNREHHADVYRSIPLSTLQPLAELAGVRLINLQFGDGIEQLDRVSFSDQILRLPDHVDTSDGAFTDTAAIIKNLDAVVTTDTAIAHLAGALGSDVWVLLGLVPDWRWLTEGNSTPWYPSMRLLRQQNIGDWDTVVDELVSKL